MILCGGPYNKIYFFNVHTFFCFSEQLDKWCEYSLFQFFSKYFKETVLETSGRKTPFEVSLAIQGYGQFSYCKYYLDPKCCSEMFANILSKAEEFLK